MSRPFVLANEARPISQRKASVIRQNFWPLILVSAFLALRLASETTANASFFVLASYALIGRSQAIQALTLSWLYSMLSEGVAPPATQAAIGRYAVIAAAALSVILRTSKRNRSRQQAHTVFITLGFGAFIIGHSWLFSPVVDVSVLKAIAWTVALTTLLSAWGGLATEERNVLQMQIFLLLTAILVVSLPLVVLPMGYLINGTGFQGVLNQPQAFGASMALLGAFVLIQLFAQVQPRWRDLALASACLPLVVLSEARTAGIALVLAVGVALIATSRVSGRPLLSLLPGLRSRRMHALMLFAAVGIILAAPALTKVMDRYLSKSGRAEVTSLAEAYQGSRGGLIEVMWDNIEETPWTGIGFGIASFPSDMIVVRDPVLNLPTSASIEKGVLPVAVLEELGLPGFIFFLVWIGHVTRRAARNGALELALIVNLLLLNLGESMLFSPSGFGMINLIILAWAVTCPKRPAGFRRYG
jgi:hypothetical protein